MAHPGPPVGSGAPAVGAAAEIGDVGRGRVGGGVILGGDSESTREATRAAHARR